jgi:hypothetical protein
MSFVSQCFFEYGQRWPELRPYLDRILGDRVTQDGGERDAYDVFLEAMEARDRDIEDHLNNRPCGGGGSVYCGQTYGTLDSGLTAQLETSVSFDLGSTSTVGISINFTADNSSGIWNTGMAFDWAITGSGVAIPSIYQANPSISTATTLASGSHTVVASVTGSTMNNVAAGCTIMVVVGSDTQDDCVTYE